MKVLLRNQHKAKCLNESVASKPKRLNESLDLKPKNTCLNGRKPFDEFRRVCNPRNSGVNSINTNSYVVGFLNNVLLQQYHSRISRD